MIKSIFYSRFHPEKGPTIAHQVPAGSISLTIAPTALSQQLSDSQTLGGRGRSLSPPTSRPTLPKSTSERTWTDASLSGKQGALFSFSAISDYLIPRPEYRNTCITICVNGYRVVGYPVCIYGKQYPRNEFIFNIAIVVDIDSEVTVWTGIVRRVAALLQEMEEMEGFLTVDEMELVPNAPSSTADTIGDQGGGKVYALCEMILEDLNNYSECMIPLDTANTLNLKLFPLYPPPPEVANYHVPLLTVELSSLMDPTWDLTMQRVTPHINGVNSVARIANDADADAHLVRQAIRHLVYYGCCLLLDVFSFAASYAVTPAFGAFVADEDMQDECARYISVAVAVSLDRRSSDRDNASETQPKDRYADLERVESTQKDMEVSEVKRDDVIRLYASLRQGVPLRVWCLDNKETLVGVDVRRFITFGVIRGFLYRIHKYAVATAPGEKLSRVKTSTNTFRRSTKGDPGARQGSIHVVGGNDNHTEENLEVHLSRYLDGMHCFDEICTDLHAPDKDILSALKTRGDVQIVQR